MTEKSENGGQSLWLACAQAKEQSGNGLFCSAIRANSSDNTRSKWKTLGQEAKKSLCKRSQLNAWYINKYLGMVGITPDLQDTNVLLCWKLETKENALQHQLALDAYKQIDESGMLN